MKKKALMFPGQGSQKIGMGEGLWDKYHQEVLLANEILGYDAKAICLDRHNLNQLNLTQFTQPLLFLVNYLTFLNRQSTQVEEDKEDFFEIALGHSLGEYNALLVAKVFSFENGISIVQERARLMAQAGEGSDNKTNRGGMAAILGMEDRVVEEIINRNDNLEVANYNSNGQLVISGKLKALQEVEEEFKSKGAKRFILLPVSGAFHSSKMKNAAQSFRNFLDKFEFKPPQKKVVANITANYYPLAADSIKDYLYQQIFSPVLWKQSILFLRKQLGKNLELEEIGPGKVLSNLVKRI